MAGQRLFPAPLANDPSAGVVGEGGHLDAVNQADSIPVAPEKGVDAGAEYTVHVGDGRIGGQLGEGWGVDKGVVCLIGEDKCGIPAPTHKNQ